MSPLDYGPRRSWLDRLARIEKKVDEILRLLTGDRWEPGLVLTFHGGKLRYVVQADGKTLKLESETP